MNRFLKIVLIAAALFIHSVPLLAATGPTSSREAAATGEESGTLAKPMPAPEIDGIAAWLNSPPLTMAAMRGKVVLIDFWTYSCINCVRTLPHLTSWDAKYRDKGLVIIGVHSPEFEFEKNADNVKAAIAKYGIKYPVALDSNLVTWKNFSNRFWPAHYLINKEGRIVYTHFGEGEYDVTENWIRKLLGLPPETAKLSDSEYSDRQTPETYVGYDREKNFASNELMTKDGTGHYSLPDGLDNDHWALSGDWLVTAESIEATQAGTRLRFRFEAQKVYIVMSNGTGAPVTAHVRFNNRPPPAEMAGSDLQKGVVTVDHEGLYQILRNNPSNSGTLEIEADKPGLRIYAFTFGS